MVKLFCKKLKKLEKNNFLIYIKTCLEYAETNKEIFEVDAINALYLCSKSLPRRLNTMIINCLMLGFQNKVAKINTEIVMNAKNEMDLLN